MGVPFLAGQRVLASDLNLATQQGVWTTYTPTWTGGGSPAIGNGTILGTYAKVGRMVTARIVFVAGSTTAFGSGAYTFSLPFPASIVGAPSSSVVAAGSAFLVVTNSYVMSAWILQSSPTVVIGNPGGSSGNFGAANPVALTSSSQWNFTITYESTS